MICERFCIKLLSILLEALAQMSHLIVEKAMQDPKEMNKGDMEEASCFPI